MKPKSNQLMVHFRAIRVMNAKECRELKLEILAEEHQIVMDMLKNSQEISMRFRKLANRTLEMAENLEAEAFKIDQELILNASKTP